MKTLWIQFLFYDDEWKEAKEFWKESEIRSILMEGGKGELLQLLKNHWQMQREKEENENP